MHSAMHRFSWEGHWVGLLISNSKKKMYPATSGLYFRRVCPAFLQLLFQAGIFKWILVYCQAAARVGSPLEWALLWKCISCTDVSVCISLARNGPGGFIILVMNGEGKVRTKHGWERQLPVKITEQICQKTDETSMAGISIKLQGTRDVSWK